MEPTGILVDNVIHPLTLKPILDIDFEKGLFGVGSNGFPHGGIHLAKGPFHAPASGELLAARLDSEHPFLLIRHRLPLQGGDPLIFYTLFAGFTPWSRLDPKKRQALRLPTKQKFPAFVKEETSQDLLWHPDRGLALLDGKTGKVAGVIPYMHEALILGDAEPPLGKKGKGWRLLRYGTLEGLACLRKQDYRRIDLQRIRILCKSTPIPKGQRQEPSIPLYATPKMQEPISCIQPYTLAEAELASEEWALLHSIQERQLKEPLYIRRRHLALGADPMPGQEGIWEGRCTVPAGTLLGYGNEVHWECFMGKSPRTLPKPPLARLMPQGSWKAFCTYPEGCTLEGHNEWAGFTKALEAASSDSNRAEARMNFEECRWWSPYMESVLDLPPAHSLFHIHPVLFASRCNHLREKRPRSAKGEPLAKGDWMDLNALLSLLRLEMQRLGLQSGSAEVIPLFKALHARLHSRAQDWRHCTNGLQLLRDAYSAKASPLNVEDWLASTLFSDAEVQAFAAAWALPHSQAVEDLRLYHPSDQTLLQQGWQLEALECKGGHEPVPQAIGKLLFYKPHRPERGYLTRPVPILQAVPLLASKGDKVKIRLTGWKPMPPPGTPTEHLEWSVWAKGQVQAVQKGGSTLAIDMPDCMDTSLMLAMATYKAQGHLSHSQVAVLFRSEEKRKPEEKPSGEIIQESVLQEKGMLAHYMTRLGYWCSSPERCSSALLTLQLEHGLTLSGVLDEATSKLIAHLMAEGAFAKELRGRPGLQLTVTPSIGKAFSTCFVQLPAPMDQAYTLYGDSLETRKNGGALDKCYSNEKWGQRPMVLALEKLLCYWHEEKKDCIAVNDLSYYLGGKSPSHKSHQKGLDVDLRSPTVGACEICGKRNSSYDQDLTIAFIDKAMDLGFKYFCTFDNGLVSHFAKDPRGKVAYYDNHQHHLHMHFGS